MGLYLNEHWRIKSYSATTRNGKSVVRIEVETEDHNELGFFLSGLAKIEADQRALKKRPPKPTLLALPAPGGQS